RLFSQWAQLQVSRKIKGFSTPAALALSPQLMERNRARLRAIDLQAVRETLETAAIREGYNRVAFAGGFKLLDELQAIVDPRMPLPHWRDKLPKSSSWWFLVDRYFAQDPLLTTGFVTTNAPITRHAEYETLSRELPVANVPMILSGWSYTLANLRPWSRRKLLIITG